MKKLFLILLPVLILHSCTLITDPDRIYNQNAHPPKGYTFNFNEIPEGKHLNGTVVLNFDPPDINYSVKKISLFIDSNLVAWGYKLPFQFDLNTNQYPEGPNLITFYVYSADDQLGLLNILDAPSGIYETTLYFDRTPPDNVILSDPVADLNGMRINWTESANENFFAYIIYKTISDREYIPLDTIYNKNDTEYVDQSYVNLTGLKYQYKVNVTTDPQFSVQASSNIGVYICGNPIRYNFDLLQEGPFCSNLQSRVYFIADNKFISFSTVDESYVNEVSLTGLIIAPADDIKCLYNKDESRIYLYNASRNILRILNSADLSTIKTFEPVQARPGYDLLVPDDNRIIINLYEGILLIDVNTNTLIKYLPLYRPVLTAVGLTGDRTRLVALHNVNNNYGFYLIDVTDNELNITDSVETGKYYFQFKSAGNLFCGDGKWLYNSDNWELIGMLTQSEYNYFSILPDRVAVSTSATYQISGFELTGNKISLFNSNAGFLTEIHYVGYNQISLANNKIYVRANNVSQPGDDILGYIINYGE